VTEAPRPSARTLDPGGGRELDDRTVSDERRAQPRATRRLVVRLRERLTMKRFGRSSLLLLGVPVAAGLALFLIRLLLD
jgi:hypothetical protein